MTEKIPLHLLATGVPGLDEILNGGLPEFSFNLVVGPPGSGKTTLVYQIMFAVATAETPVLFFSVMGEPPWKMLRYQQQYAFFDFDKINESIHLVNLNEAVWTGDLEQVLAHIKQAIETFSPRVVIIDSFLSVMREMQEHFAGRLNAQQFTQELGLLLAGYQTTSLLVGEYLDERDLQPIFLIADGVLTLEQSTHRNSVVRKFRVLKMRGQAPIPCLHSFRISREGIQVFPSALIRDDSGALAPLLAQPHGKRLTLGVPGLDEMLGGGLPAGYSLLVAGPSGSGKSILATSFLADGVQRGEPGVMVAIEQTPSQSWSQTIDRMVRAGQIGLINTRLLDLSIDEVVHHLVQMIRQMKAVRVVIDSLSGFELAVAPTFREDFRESLFRLVTVLSGMGVTTLLTSELEDRYVDLRFSPYGAAFLTDAIIVQRYIEIESHLKRVMAVVKVRGSKHSKEIRQYEIGDKGIEIGLPILDYDGLLSGRPQRRVAPESGE